ncbi:MAG TPA: nitrite reductase [Paenibacillus sp.]|nr:nitrite reductase [Paenibacillus sp.]
MEKTKIAVTSGIQVGGNLFTPEQLALIGSLAGPDGSVEVTPFRQMYIEVAASTLGSVEKELGKAGLQVMPAGFAVKGLIACNFCKGAEEAGLEIARELNEAIAGIPTPTPIRVGYAGCALGTSEPLLKDIGIVKMRDAFDIYVGGDPKGLKATTGQLLATGIASERLGAVVKRIIDFYIQHAKGKEKFSKFIARISIEEMKRIAV